MEEKEKPSTAEEIIKETVEEKTNYTKKAVRGAGLMTIMLVLSSGLSYLVRIVLARNLSTTEFGLFYAVFTFIMFFLVFRDFGLGTALTKFIAEYNIQKDYNKIKTLMVSSFIFQLISSSLLILFLWVASSYLSTHYFKTPLASSILKLLSLYVVFSLLLKFVRDVLVGFQETRWYSLTEPLREGLALIFSLLFFYLGQGIFSPVFGFLIMAFLSFLILLIGVRKYFFILKYKLVNFWGTAKQLFSFAVPVIFGGVGNTLIAHLDILILTYFVPLSLVGIYSVVLPTSLMFLVFGNAVAQILFPMTSELWAKKDKIRLAEGFKLVHSYSFLLTVPLLVAIFIFADVFIGNLFGKDYLSGVLAFRVLLLGIPFYVIAVNNQTMISALGKPLLATKIILISALVNALFNFLLIPSLSINGAAVANTLGYVVVMVLSTIKIARFIEVTPPWKNWLKILFSALVFFFVLFFLKSVLGLLPLWLNIPLSLSAAGLVYLGLIFWLKIVDWSEIKMIIKRVL